MAKEEFFLKEYECLRREIELVIKQSRELERNVAAAIAAIYVWLLKGGEHSVTPPKEVWFIPFILAVLGAIRARGINESFEQFHLYVIKLENFFASGNVDPSGWEHEGKTGIAEARGAVLFWLLLMMLTLGFAIWEWCKA